MSDTKPVALFCSDLDGTLLGLPKASLDFRATWEALGDHSPMLVYSTGRLVEDARRVITEAGLPDPDYYIGGVGTMIHDVATGQAVEAFGEVLSKDWDREKAVEVVRGFQGIEEQADEQQNPWKSSWFWHDASEDDLDRLREALSQAGVVAQVIYSSARDLDVLPHQANKGNALRWLCARHEIAIDDVVVAGDTGNDSSMFLVPGVRGVAPGNAEPELAEVARQVGAYQAAGQCAAGIMEGLMQYGLFTEITESSENA